MGRVGKGLLLLPQEDTVQRESTDGKQEESGETGKGGNTLSATSTCPGGHKRSSGGPTAPPVWVAHGEEYDGDSRGTMGCTQSRNPALTTAARATERGVVLDAFWDARNTSKVRMKIRCRLFHICFCHYLISCKCIHPTS